MSMLLAHTFTGCGLHLLERGSYTNGRALKILSNPCSLLKLYIEIFGLVQQAVLAVALLQVLNLVHLHSDDDAEPLS